MIELQLPIMQGSVQSVDAKKLTLLLRPGRGDDIQLDIAKDAKIVVDGKAGNLEGVGVGAAQAEGDGPGRGLAGVGDGECLVA